MILSVGNKYSMPDLLCDIINNDWPAKQRYASHTVNDVRASSGISWL